MANLIENGSFVDHANGWIPGNDQTAIAFDAADGDGAGGSLKLTVATNGQNVMARYRPRWARTVPNADLAGETLGAACRAKSAAGFGLVCTVRCYDNAYALGATLATFARTVAGITGDGTWQAVAFTDGGQTVPGGTTHVQVDLASTSGPQVANPIFVDGFWVGSSPAGAPPYPAADIPTTGNRVANGDIEDPDVTWIRVNATETVARTTTAPLAGTASLSVETPGMSGFDGVEFPGVVFVPGETVPVTVRARGEGTIQPLIYYTPSGNTELDPIVLTPSPQEVVAEVVAPAGAWSASLYLVRPSGEPGTFVVEVFVGEPAEGEPVSSSPGIPGSLLALGLGLGGS